MLTDPNALAAKAWEDACHGTDAENIAAIAAVYAPLFEELSDNGELLTIAWMDGSHSSNMAHRARIAELEAEVERLREALVATEGAIAEYYRYWTGGEMRGSYDGKPERAGLWKSRQTARAALKDTRHD